MQQAHGALADCIVKLAALIPKQRTHLTRFHEVFVRGVSRPIASFVFG